MNFLIAAKHIFITYIQGHMYIAIVLIIIFGLLLLRKPRIFFTILFIALFLTGVLYLISALSTTGASQKQKLLNQEEQLLNKDFR
jgi:multisubunit Na+/H+ antiporter MnhC subunit